jgi:hypothetical protein
LFFGSFFDVFFFLFSSGVCLSPFALSMVLCHGMIGERERERGRENNEREEEERK